jgi:Golgi phosphoprotein 3 GPP34
MSSLDEVKLADGLWLAAHDSPRRKSQLGERPLNLGLGGALLGELLLGGSIAVEGGRIYPQRVAYPDDPALAAVATEIYRDNTGRIGGLILRDWIRYLATDSRAADLVTNRLSLAGVIRREEHKSLFGGVKVRYQPRDSVVSGAPVASVNLALSRGHELDQTRLTLAGLFLATGLHQQAFATQTPDERALLGHQLKGLHPALRELLRAVEQVVGEAVMLR